MRLSPRDFMLQARLEELYRTYGPEGMCADPIVFLSRYESDEDREVVGWIPSAFAYGRVETIQDNVGRILEPLGRHPARALDRIGDFREFARESLRGFRHRFHGAPDAALLLFVIARARSNAGSIRRFFEAAFRPEKQDIGGLLSRVSPR